jgi:hypothetical protein
MRIRPATILIAGLLLLPACSEQGPDVEKVKLDVTAELAAMAGPDGQKYLGYDGVEAAADGDKTKVTVKGLKFLVAGAEAMTIGDVEFHALAKGDDQYEITDLKIPAKMTFKGPQGEVVAEVAAQTWSGLWSTKYHSFLSGDGKYTGIKLSGPGMEGAAAEVAEIAMKMTSEDRGNGVFDQTGTGTLKSLKIAGPEGSGAFASGEFKSEVKGARLADMQSFGRDWQAFVMGMSEGKPADATLLGRLKGYASMLAGMSMQGDLRGASFKDAAGAEMFSAEHVTFNGAGSGFDQPKAGVTFDIGFLGVKVPAADDNPMVAAYKQFIPSLVRFGYALDDIPPKELWSAWLDMMASGAFAPGNEAAAEAAAQGFGMQLLQLAVQAGSAFRITNFEIESPAARLKMDGKVKSDTASPMGASGTANIEVAGLDAIADAVKQSLPPEEAAGASGAFDVVRGFSNRETTADNGVVDRYAIVLTPAGEMTINNKPFDLFGMMMGMPGGTAAPTQ